MAQDGARPLLVVDDVDLVAERAAEVGLGVEQRLDPVRSGPERRRATAAMVPAPDGGVPPRLSMVSETLAASVRR